jgi:hypothetical protein
VSGSEADRDKESTTRRNNRKPQDQGARAELKRGDKVNMTDSANIQTNSPAPQITSEITPKEPKMLQKTKDAIAMVNAGISPANALKAVNFKRKISHQAIAELKQKVNKCSLSQPNIVKLAHNAIKDCLNNRPINGEIYPTHTNKLAAATMVYDRIEPVVRQNLNINIDVHPVDLTAWSNRKVEEKQEAIDITPCG